MMAEFQEVLNQFNRMCRYYQVKHECPMGCPMNGVNRSQCRKFAFERPEVTEKIVMDWAAEHPELVYPRWIDWLIDVGLIINTADHYAFNFTAAVDQIPADIAEKLGIEPKEDIC